ncbi:MAG: hypothetical protein AABZ47_13020, partial [Planctomycetota bacterium]
MQRLALISGVLFITLFVGGCGDVRDFNNSVEELFTDVQQSIEQAVADPLGAKPFPVIVGGDSEKLYYATSLTDVRLNFPGDGNDVVFPSFSGPSNLYQYADRERTLLQPLVPTGAYFGLATDGRFIVYAKAPPSNGPSGKLHVIDTLTGTDRALFLPSNEPGLLLVHPSVKVSAGRAAYSLQDTENDSFVLRVKDLAGSEPTIEVENVGSTFSLDNDRLAFIRRNGPTSDLVLKGLSTGEDIVIEGHLDDGRVLGSRIVMSDNSVVWQDENSGPIFRYDIPTGETRVWKDTVTGFLVGATDEFFIVEEYVYRSNQADQIRVTRTDSAGEVRTLATFVEEGLAGQTQ